MYQINRNNFHKKPKNSTVYTPLKVSKFLFELLSKKVKSGLILDIGCGSGNLLHFWKENYHTLGLDREKNANVGLQTDFLKLTQWEYQLPALIISNPPFNGYYPKLAGEIWLDKIIELFGKKVPMAIFFPYSFRLGVKEKSKRLQKFLNGFYPTISSIISLPLDIYSQVKFHSEILIFNIRGLKPHYFLPKYSKRQLVNKANYQKNKQARKEAKKTRYRSDRRLDNFSKLSEKVRKSLNEVLITQISYLKEKQPS
jgi:hypothetical protein